MSFATVLLILGLARAQDPVVAPVDVPPPPVAAPTEPKPPEEIERETRIFDRLLGGAEAPPPTPLPVATQPMHLWSWAWVGAAAILLPFVWYIKRRMEQRVPKGGSIQVLSQTPFGRGGVLAIVRVEDEDGFQRRLLVGMGSGDPTLVADLGTSEEEDGNTPGLEPRSGTVPASDDPPTSESEEDVPEFMKDRILMDRLERERKLLEVTEKGPLPDFIDELLAERHRPDDGGDPPSAGLASRPRPSRRTRRTT